MLYYKLDKNIAGEKILSDIQKLLSRSENLESSVLVISVQKIIDYAGDSLLPKITYENKTNQEG